MSNRSRFLLALAAAWGVLVAVASVTALVMGADLTNEERAAAVVVIALLLPAPLWLVLRGLFRHYVSAARKLAEDARIMLAANPAHRAPVRGSAELRRLAATVNELADA